MANLHSDIQRLVDTFVAEVTDLARRAAMDTLASAFNGGGRGGRVGGGAMRLGRGRGAKRSSSELDQLAEQFAAYVKKETAKWAEVVKKSGAKLD